MAEQTPLHPSTAASGASFQDEAGWLMPEHFGDARSEYEAARAGAVLFDRSSQGSIEALGREAVFFLHNVSSNDIKNLPGDHGCEAFFCNHTARVLAHVFLFRDPPDGRKDRLWIDTAPGRAGEISAHLDRHLISEDVVLTDRTQEFARLHLAGPGASELVAKVLGVEGLEPLRQRRTELGVLRRIEPLALPGYDLIVPKERGQEAWSKFIQAGAKPAGRQAWEILRIEAGTPLYGVDITENTFAPEVGRIKQAISYNKGCYLGQEPIVMARDRGQVNRTLLGLKWAGEPAPGGSGLFRDGKEVGKVASSIFSPSLKSAIALAYVKRGHQQPGTMVEIGVGEQRWPAEVVALPFVATEQS